VTRHAPIPLDEPDTFTLGEWLELTSYEPTEPEPTEARASGPPVDRLPLLAELLRAPSWHARAACRGVGPSDFYPEHGSPGLREAAERARALCARCPVVAECGEAGRREDHGRWGGLAPSKRRRTAA
jgi:WhiB family redox-sensing transcriptional regulator